MSVSRSICMLRDAIGTMTTEIHIVLPTMRSTENSYDYVIAYHGKNDNIFAGYLFNCHLKYFFFFK